MTDFLLTDTHFGVKNYSMSWWRAQQDFIYKQFIPATENYKDDVRVIHLGDVFDNRSGINTLIAAGVRQLFEAIANVKNVKEVIIIAGNHDFYSPDTDEYCTIETILNNIPKIKLVTREVYETQDSVFVPWFIAEQGLDRFTDKIIYTHSDITHLSFPKPVYSGHVHEPKLGRNSYNLGSCYPLTFADSNSSRGFYIKTEDELKFIPNHISIQFWRIYNDEIFNDLSLRPHDYIEIYIDRDSLTKPTCQERLSELRSKYKNLWIIPQQKDIEIKTMDVTKDISQIIESHIPDELIDKFNIIKGALN